MKRCYVLLLLAFLLALPHQLFAQAPGPDLPKMSNLAFGWVSMSGLDPNMDMFTAFAPNMLFVKDYGYTSGGEAAVGTFTFGDFEVDSNFNCAMTSLGPGMFRLSHFGFISNNASLANLMPGVLAKTHGEAIELSYAQRVGNAAIGLSFIPMDSTNIQLSAPGMTGSGKSRADYGLRVGTSLPLTETIKFGADYSYQEDHASMTTTFDGLPDPIVLDGEYVTRCGTVGLSYQATPDTLVYSSFQQINADGTGIDRTATLYWAGVQQQITRDLAVRANYLDGGLNFSATWVSKIGVFNAAYTHKALRNAEDLLGDGDAFFVGMGVAF